MSRVEFGSITVESQRSKGSKTVSCTVFGEISASVILEKGTTHQVLEVPPGTYVSRTSLGGCWVETLMFPKEGPKLALWGNDRGDPLPTLTESSSLTAVGRFLSNEGPVEYVVGDLRLSRREGRFLNRLIVKSIADFVGQDPTEYAEAASMAMALATRIREIFPEIRETDNEVGRAAA